MKKRGFTLVELAVVICIIVILFTILMTAMLRRSVRDKPNQLVCASNLRQIMMGVQMYTQDYDDVLPVATQRCRRRATSENRISVVSRIYSYVKNAEVFDCPSRRFSNWCNGHGIPEHNLIEEVREKRLPTGFTLGYGFVEDTFERTHPAWSYSDPASTVYVGDASGSISLYRLAASDASVCAVTGSDGCEDFTSKMSDRYARHNGGSQCGFMDGHAKWLSWQDCLAVNILP